MIVTANDTYTVNSVREKIAALRMPRNVVSDTVDVMRIVISGIHMELTSTEWNEILDLAVKGYEKC